MREAPPLWRKPPRFSPTIEVGPTWSDALAVFDQHCRPHVPLYLVPSLALYLTLHLLAFANHLPNTCQTDSNHNQLGARRTFIILN